MKFAILFLICIGFVPNIVLANVANEMSYDLSLLMSPQIHADDGYKDIKLNIGAGISVSFFTHSNGDSIGSKKIRLLKIGIGMISDKTIFILSPMSIHFHDHLYMDYSIGLGEKPHTLMGVNYLL